MTTQEQKELFNNLTAKQERLAELSDDCFSVSVYDEEGKIIINVEDWGAGARGPQKDPDVSEVVRAITKEVARYGARIRCTGEGDGATGHIDCYEVIPCPRIAWINSGEGRLAVEKAYTELTGRPFSSAYATTHNGAQEPLWGKIKRTVLNSGCLDRCVSGGLRIGDLLDKAGCPKKEHRD